ncbi:MAG: prolyl oligopeptidase family serine peptidase [Candidatus Thorarchaeota archaeon]
MTLPRILQARVSPDKQGVAFVANRLQQNYDVFLASLRDSDMVPLTNTPEVTFLTDWAPDSRSILVGEDTARDERVTLYRVFLDAPTDMVPVTETNPDHFMHGGLFTPDGDRVVYAVNYDYDTKREVETFRVVVQDLESNDRLVVARPDRPAYMEISVDPKGKYVLYSRSDEDPSGLQWWIATLDGTEDREILNFGPKAKVSARWTHDGRILFHTDTLEGERHDSVAIGLLELSSGDTEWLAEPSESEPFDWSFVPRESNHVIIVREREARRRPFIYDLDTLRTVDCTPLRGNLWPISPLSNTEWVGFYYSSTSPKELVRFNPFNPDPSSFKYITRMLEASGLRKEDLTPAQDFRWISVDNTMIHGWLYVPSKPNGKTIVSVHGGPTAHSEDDLSVNIQYLCSKGFTVLDPNYRGSTGYGVNFRELIKKDGWGGNDKEDIRTGIEALIEKGHARPGSVGIFGTSYGGYMSWCAIVHFPPEVLAAAAPICGMTDLVVDYETTRPDIRPYSEEMLGGSPKEVPAVYHARSPINFVENIKGRLLIVQGLRDPNVTKANVEEVEKRLQEHQIPYEKLVFEDEGHGVIREKNVKILLERLSTFFDSALP